jgi:hypothetical protein
LVDREPIYRPVEDALHAWLNRPTLLLFGLPPSLFVCAARSMIPRLIDWNDQIYLRMRRRVELAQCLALRPVAVIISLERVIDFRAQPTEVVIAFVVSYIRPDSESDGILNLHGSAWKGISCLIGDDASDVPHLKLSGA